MSLEDLYIGKIFYFRVVRYRRSGRKTIVPLEVHIRPGTSAGTEIVVDGVGNERKDGTMQAIVFLVKEAKHERFTRMQEDLLMEARLPWVNSLNEEPGRVYFQSIDGKDYMFNVDYHMNGLLSGTTVIPDAGMPICGGPGRGRVVIRYVRYVTFFFD
jgi:DnaJ family protein B protein 4